MTTNPESLPENAAPQHRPAPPAAFRLQQIFLFFLMAVSFMANCAAAAETRFAVAQRPAPVLNSPDFRAVFGGSDGRSLQKDRCGQLRAVEFIALPGTVFTIHEEIAKGAAVIYRVSTRDYPYPSASGFFIDARSVAVASQRPPERLRTLPSRDRILASLESRVGTRYVWGGNVAAGVAELAQWYPPAAAVDRPLWQLAGLDCSGLLYEATNGFTPRNTSSLATFGEAVPIAGKTAREVAAGLQPLDLIVWPGHVMIVLDRDRVIESRLVCGKPGEGVRIRPLAEGIAAVMKKRRPVDGPVKGTAEFVVRRWYDTQAVSSP